MKIDEKDLLDLIHWARRYCDYRSTYAPTAFNWLYDRLASKYPDLIEKDQFDDTLYSKGKFWPYAQDGMYNSENDSFDARPIKYE